MYSALLIILNYFTVCLEPKRVLTKVAEPVESNLPGLALGCMCELSCPPFLPLLPAFPSRLADDTVSENQGPG